MSGCPALATRLEHASCLLTVGARRHIGPRGDRPSDRSVRSAPVPPSPRRALSFRRRLAASALGEEPARRLVVANSLGVAGDAAFTVSLAGSLFFNVSIDAARPSIVLYLVLTLAPFAVVGPFVGAFVDRFAGRQRRMIAATNLLRAVTMFALASQLTSLAFFPLAFGVLVLGKAASVAKSSLVPLLVADDRRLVAENARLSRATAIAGGVSGTIAAGAMGVVGPEIVLLLGACVHLLAVPAALRIPWMRPRPAEPIVDDVELRGGAVSLAANAMGVMRAAVGFLSFLLAFELKSSGEPAWWFGLVIAAGGVGGFVGTFVASAARRHFHEETILTVSLVLCGAVTVLAALQFQRSSPVVVAVAIGVGASVARQAFDAFTQRYAPDAEKGRAFARFESRFQIAWVLGALAPVVVRPAANVGIGVLGAVLVGSGLLFRSALRAVRRHQLVLQAAIDRRERDLARSLLAVAGAMHAQGAGRLSITTAADAVRVATAGHGRAPDLGHVAPELDAIWQRAVAGTRSPSDEEVARALALARRAVDVARRAQLDSLDPTAPVEVSRRAGPSSAGGARRRARRSTRRRPA